MNDERDSETGKSSTDPIFKQVIITLFQGWDVDIQTEVEVGLAPLRIDVVISIRSPEIFTVLSDQTPFGHFLTDNILEFKGVGDPLTLADFYRIVMRSYHYFLERDVSVAEMTVTIICAQTPRKVLSHPQFGFQKRAEGYYLCDALGLPITLIATNELPIEPMYYSLLLFASSKVKSQEIIEEIVKNNQGQYFSYASVLHPELVQEVLEMAKRRNQLEDNLKILAQNMGSQLIPYMNPEDLFRESTPEQRLQGVSLAQRLQGSSPEDILDALSDEDRQALRQLLEDQDTDT